MATRPLTGNKASEQQEFAPISHAMLRFRKDDVAGIKEICIRGGPKHFYLVIDERFVLHRGRGGQPSGGVREFRRLDAVAAYLCDLAVTSSTHITLQLELPA